MDEPADNAVIAMDSVGAEEMKVDTTVGSSYILPSAQRQSALESSIIFLLMSPYGNHQSDMMHRVLLQLSAATTTGDNSTTTTTSSAASCFSTIDAVYLKALTLFTTHEIIVTPFPGQMDIIERHPTAILRLPADTAAYFIQLLKDRIVQHNLRVIARYYKRIRTSRLASLLDLSHPVLEKYLSEAAFAAVSSNNKEEIGEGLYLKIDRPAGIVSFQAKQQPEEVLTAWSSDMTKMLQLMESTCHLINRENMVYKV